MPERVEWKSKDFGYVAGVHRFTIQMERIRAGNRLESEYWLLDTGTAKSPYAVSGRSGAKRKAESLVRADGLAPGQEQE